MIERNTEDLCGYIVPARTGRLRVVQLDLLRAFKGFYNVYRLHYYLWSGTSLGTMRHQGFIPWDDNVDAAMPRRDYGALKRLAVSELSAPYTLHTNENDSGIFRESMYRLCNSNTTRVEYREINSSNDWGIQIDILALDHMFENEEKHKNQFRKITIYERLCLI